MYHVTSKETGSKFYNNLFFEISIKDKYLERLLEQYYIFEHWIEVLSLCKLLECLFHKIDNMYNPTS